MYICRSIVVYLRQIWFISSSSSVVNLVLFSAFRLLDSCSTELEPMMTEVTDSSFSNHARAISARVCPRRQAISFSNLMRCSICSVNDSFFREPLCDIRDPSGIPFRYRSVSSPCANGEKAMKPVPF